MGDEVRSLISLGYRVCWQGLAFGNGFEVPALG
jgi:hypothetical protein